MSRSSRRKISNSTNLKVIIVTTTITIVCEFRVNARHAQVT